VSGGQLVEGKSAFGFLAFLLRLGNRYEAAFALWHLKGPLSVRLSRGSPGRPLLIPIQVVVTTM
jgi:hypothetical protein